MSPVARERFAQVIAGSEEERDLAEAALLIAQEEQPELDIAAYRRRLDELAAAVRARLRWISGEGGMIFPRHSGLIKHPDSGKTTHDEQI